MQTLVATGASSFTRRALTASTSGSLALLGSILGISGAYLGLGAIYSDRFSDLQHPPLPELGVLLFGLYRVSSGTENHSYSSSPDAPTEVKLTAGTEYELSVPGGQDALVKRGADTQSAQCEWSVNGTAPQAHSRLGMATSLREPISCSTVI